MSFRLAQFARALLIMASLDSAGMLGAAARGEEFERSTGDWVTGDLKQAFEQPLAEPAAAPVVQPIATPIVEPVEVDAHRRERAGDDPESIDASASETPSNDDSPPESEAPPDCDGPHQVWLISSRPISCYDDPALAVENIRYWRYVRGEGWLDSSLDEFRASDDSAMPTVVYVHGHRINQQWAATGGWDAYRTIVKPTAIPTRFVIWSWPTSPNGHPMREFRIRACESEVHGYYLAWVLDHIQPNVPIHLVGFSYGSRLITSTLHYLGGGAIDGRALDERVYPERIALRASLIAGALDNDWLLPDRRHGQALTQVDRMFITRNTLDPVLHWYPVVLHDRDAVALGVTGVAGINRLGEDRVKIEQLNVRRDIGKRHAIALYWEVEQVVAILRGMSDDADAPPLEATPASIRSSAVSGPMAE